MRWYRAAKRGDGYKPPHQMSPDEFVSYHMTGFIPSRAYEEYGKRMPGDPSLSKYPVLVKTLEHGGERIEYRKTGKATGYLKLDEQGNIIRGPDGMALTMTPDEVRAKGYPETETTIVAFNEQGMPVGTASDEFGTDGIWVLDAYQRRGIGTELLDMFREQFHPSRQMGQMTNLGQDLVRAYHRRQVQKALEQNIDVPENVLKAVETPPGPYLNQPR